MSSLDLDLSNFSCRSRMALRALVAGVAVTPAVSWASVLDDLLPLVIGSETLEILSPERFLLVF